MIFKIKGKLYFTENVQSKIQTIKYITILKYITIRILINININNIYM